MLKLKRVFSFTIFFICISFLLNVFVYGIIEMIPFLFNTDSLIENLISCLIHGVILLFFVITFDIKRYLYIYPVIYLILSLALFCHNYFISYDLFYLVNFEFSRLSYLTYESLNEIFVIDDVVIDVAVFNIVYFINLVAVLFVTKLLFCKVYEEDKTNVC